jgi:hypothetical protein
MGMLALLTGLLYAAFEVGTRVFRDTSVRASSENQFRGIKLLFERDVHHTNIWLVNKNGTPRTVTVDGQDYQRDALSMGTLSDWNDPANFDDVGLAATHRPLYNRYIVWYATTDTPRGSLFRQLVDPAGTVITTPYNVLGTNLRADPSLNDNVVYTRVMSEDLLGFETDFRFQDGTLSAKVTLQAEGGLRPGTQTRTRENLQVRFTFQPKNNFPQI